MNKRIMYLRDANYFPVGCVAITLNRHKNTVEYQLSVLNPQDRFDRKVARQLALGRLVEAPVTVVLSGHATMHEISLAVMKSIVSLNSAPSRAVKAAKTWLKWQGTYAPYGLL